MSEKNIILLSINATFRDNMSEKELYEVTNFAWPIDENKKKHIKYAFAIYKNKVKEVYKVIKWVSAVERIPTTRKDRLKNAGIYISLEELKKLYFGEVS